jgi:autoinducer 2 (AI-2) kinase
MSYVLTIDAGTAGGRAILFDLNGRIVARAHETWGYEFAEGAVVPFVRECSFDPEVFWSALCRCVRQVLTDGRVDADAVGAVVTTSQREGCVFLDESGREIYAGPNFDARGALEAMEAQQTVGADRLYEITGHAPPFIFPIARFLWFRKHCSDEKVRHIVMISDWIAYRLTGEVGMEPSNASESMLFDIKSRQWSSEILERLGIPADVLPPLREPGEQIGVVIPAAAETTGLRRGTPVIVGGADTHAALLGSGVIEPGETAAIIGSTVPVQMVFAEPFLDPAGSLWAGCHIVPGRWTLESNGGDSGGSYDWLLDLLGATAAPEPYEAAEAWIEPPDPSQRPPHLFIGPSIFNLINMNAYKPGGILFPFPLMDVKRPSRGDLVRGFFENVAFAVRGNCEQLTSVTSRLVKTLHVSGGMSRSRRLIQILADVMEDTLQVGVVAESAGLGCAVLGAVGLGVYPSIRDGLTAMVRLTTVEPSRDGRYAEQYAKWRELYTALDGMNI